PPSKPSSATAWKPPASSLRKKIGYSRCTSANSVGHTGTSPVGSPSSVPKWVRTRRSLWVRLSSNWYCDISAPAAPRAGAAPHGGCEPRQHATSPHDASAGIRNPAGLGPRKRGRCTRQRPHRSHQLGLGEVRRQKV